MSQLINGKMFDRSLGLGGSDATKIVAGEWKSLYEEKMGIKEPEDLSFILPVQLGIYTEPFNKEWFQTNNNGLYVKDVEDTLYHKKYDFIYANLDGYVIDDNFKKIGVFEAKHTRAYTKDDTILERYYAQVQHYMMVSKLPRTWLSVLYGNHDYKVFVIEQDKKFQKKLLNAEIFFWSHIEKQAAPDDYVDFKLIEEVY